MIRTLGLPIGAFILGVALTTIFYSPDTDIASASNQHTPLSLAGSREITCTYPRVLSASFHEGKVSHELVPPETNPIIFTFTDFGGEVAKLKYLDASRMISEALLVKISEDDEKIVFIDGTGENYISTHMIFKDAGTAVYTKGVSLFGIPSGSLAMGTCVGI